MTSTRRRFLQTGALAAGAALSPGLLEWADAWAQGQFHGIAFTKGCMGTTSIGSPLSCRVQILNVVDQGKDTLQVTGLFDNGGALAGDLTAGDGTFNNAAAITFDQPGDRFFVVKMSDGLGGMNSDLPPAPCVDYTCAPAPPTGDLTWSQAILYFVFVDRFENGDARALPHSSEVRAAYLTLAKRFPARGTDPITVIADTDPDKPAFQAWFDSVSGVDGIVTMANWQSPRAI